MKLALRIALLALVGVCAWWTLRALDWHALGATLADARLWPLIPAVAIAFAMLWLAALGLRVILAPRHAVSTRRLFRYTIVAYAASVIAPLRAGDLVRLWLMKQRDGVPIADGAAAVVAQKIVDGVAMFVVVGPLSLFLPDLPAWVGRTIGIGALVALLAFAACYLALPRVRGISWLGRFIAGMHVLRLPRRLALAFIAQLAAWLIDLAMVDLVLYAVGIDLPIPAGLLILLTLNLAMIVPVPANVGSLEVGAIAATRVLGVPDEQALGFALLYHACLVVPILVAGLALELRVLVGATPPGKTDSGHA